MNISAPDDNPPVIGRFAPSPTGRLHFGSLVTAVASYCDAKKQQGQWLVRIEDTDWQRCKAEHSEHILHTLDAFGLHWDHTVLFQSQRLELYHDALSTLINQQSAYACECSRKTLADYADKNQSNRRIYPRLCLNKQLDVTDKNIRLVVPNTTMIFDDNIQGLININPQATLGDMVLQRRDGIVNYILSAAIDDAAQGVTQVIRGLDLLELTPVQITLANVLSLDKVNTYGHLPLALNADGQKLSKQTKAQAVCTNNIPEVLQRILKALNQAQVEKDTPMKMLAQAVEQWDRTPFTRQTRLADVFD